MTDIQEIRDLATAYANRKHDHAEWGPCYANNPGLYFGFIGGWQAREAVNEAVCSAWIARVDELEEKLARRVRQVNVAIEALDSYRTLVIEEKSGAMTRLGKTAEDALELMAAIMFKGDST